MTPTIQHERGKDLLPASSTFPSFLFLSFSFLSPAADSFKTAKDTMRFPFSLPLLLLSTAAIVVVPSLALPNFGALMQRGPNGEPSHFEKRLLAADPMQLGDLVSSLKSKVAELSSQAYVPDADNLMQTPIANLTADQIYKTFGIQPAGTGHRRRKRGGGLWPLGEDKDHPWQAPAKDARRGPCPGLNTIANHGYLPRNGIVNPVELLVGTFLGLNLSPDAAAILAGISFIGVGDLLQMKLSIGGRYGMGDGLSHHGILEGDGSVTRKDHYFGNSWDADPQLVEMFVNETNTYGKGDVTLWSLANSRYRAWDQGRINNPVFDFNPWRMLVAYAESGFTFQVLRGSLAKFDEDAIRSWFLHERFPKGWRKRIVPASTPEILAWAGVISLIKPVIPGLSDGKGFFSPTAQSDALYKELSSLVNPHASNATLGDLYCDAGRAILGWVPSMITNIVGDFGVKGIGSSTRCT